MNTTSTNTADRDRGGARRVRIFISSPGDVQDEREKAREVVHQLQREYAGRLDLEPLLWEDLPLTVDMPFQEGIDLVLSTECGIDIAVFILWSRLGSPVGALIERPEGGTYRSGTEREFDLMLRVRAQSGGVRPDIIAYVRDDAGGFQERLRGLANPDIIEAVKQQELARQFISEHFHDAATGANLRAFHRFDQPVTFAHRLRTHLRGLLDDRGVRATWNVAERGAPFRGLDAFHVEHADIFFGRDREICDVQLALRAQAEAGRAFVLIVGASGSGKSSLARAGVLPAPCPNCAATTAWQTSRRACAKTRR